MNALTVQPQPQEGAVRLIQAELRRFPDDTTLVITPTRRLYHVAADPVAIQQVLQSCDGSRPIAEVLAGTPDPAGYAEVIDMLLRDGCMRSAEQEPIAADWARFESRPGAAEQLATLRLVLLGDPRLIGMMCDHGWTERFAAVDVTDRNGLAAAIAADSRPSVVLVLRQVFDQQLLMEVNDFCESHQVRWAQFHIDQGRGWLGPAIVPSCTPNYRDLLGRRLAAAESIDIFQALMTRPINDRAYCPPPAEVAWMLAFFAVDLERWLAGAPAQMPGNEVEADPLALSFTPHPVLPLPDRCLQTELLPNMARTGYELLTDDRTGLIINLQLLEHHPSIPASLTTVQSQIADMNRLYPWANNTVCSGSTFGNHRDARLAAMGEGLERYCGNWVQTTNVVQASYDELIARGEYALDPARMILYSERQYAEPGFPFAPLTRDLTIHWVRGWSLSARRAAWIPVSFVYVNWYTGAYKDDVPTNNLFYPGLAGGPSLEFALMSGLEEIIERHATMIWWANAHPLPAIKPTSELSAVWTGRPTELGQRAWIIHLDNEFDVPVIAGVVENVAERLINIGFAARADPISATFKAWSEALTLQDGSRDLDEPDGLFWQAAARRQINGSALKPWRKDRAYLDDYRADFLDVNDLMCQQQIFLDPRARAYISPWIDVAATRTFDELPRLPDRSLESYRRPVEARGYEIFYVDVTTPDVAYTDMRVVRVIVPGLVPNFPAAFPFFGHGRMQQAAVELGWRSTPLDETELNVFPMPHA